jgi:hypothetical protein
MSKCIYFNVTYQRMQHYLAHPLNTFKLHSIQWLDSISYLAESNNIKCGVGKVYEVFIGSLSLNT